LGATGAPSGTLEEAPMLAARPCGAPSYVASLAKETRVIILLHGGQELLNCVYLGLGQVAMPLQIRTHPEYPPLALGPHIRSFGK